MCRQRVWPTPGAPWLPLFLDLSQDEERCHATKRVKQEGAQNITKGTGHLQACTHTWPGEETPAVTAQEGAEKPRLGMLQELMEAKKENSEVRSSNSSLKAEIARYKADLEAKTSRAHALESNCSAAEESKIVTSKVAAPGPTPTWSACRQVFVPTF